MVFAHMNRKLGVFAAACTLALGLFGGVASAQPWEYEIYPDENDAKAQIIESVSGAETNTKGISYDVDSDGALEEIRLGYGIYEDGTINAALCIDNVKKVQGLPDGMEESSLKLELLKLPNGCLFIHAYGYCGESIGGGLDRLFKVKAVDGATDPEFAHSVTTVLDCYGNPYIMKGKGVTHANAGLAYVIGDDIVVGGSCMTTITGVLSHFVTLKCSATGKLTAYNNPTVAYSFFYDGDGHLIDYSPILRNVKVYSGVNLKKSVTVKKGTQMQIRGVYAKGNTRLLQVQTKPSGSAKTYVSGYIKLSNSQLFKYAKIPNAG